MTFGAAPIANVLDPGFVLRHLEAARRHCEAICRPSEYAALDHAAAIEPEEADALLRAHAATDPLRGPGQPLISRDPVTSVMQSVLEQKLEERFGDRIETVDAEDPANPLPAAARLVRPPEPTGDEDERMGDAFTTHDPRWVIDIAEALVDKLIRGGKHPFNDSPAPEVRMGENARLVLFSDWATGLERAQDVARHAREWILQGRRDGRDVHAIHLGDVYYSGEKSEYDKRVRAPGMWPVAPDEAEPIPSWCLNGNHDMYSGGWAYFDELLAKDDRFRRQRTPDGKGTSWFELAGDGWRVIALDTAWEDHLLPHPAWGYLNGSQADHVIRAATTGDDKLLLLSHHQLFSVYDKDGVGPTLARKLGPALETGRVRGWFWGHEHRCMGFEPHDNLPAGRCIGHGGIPEVAHAEDMPIPAPGSWEYRGQFWSSGASWARFGFAVLDFDGPSIKVSYVTELGEVDRTEVLS